MATNSTTPVPPKALPNPYTPMAFVPPDSARELQAAIYLSIAVLSAYIWDWLMSLPDEIRMCRKRQFSLALGVYFLSRLGTLINSIMIVIFLAGSVPNCEAIRNAVGVAFIFAVPLTSTLFFLRVKAVYYDNKPVAWFFGFLVLALCAISFLSPFSFKSAHLGTTQRCMGIHVEKYISVPVILQCVVDTLVFLAISFRIASYSILGDTFGDRMRSFVHGDGLTHLSRSLLQSGQIYYFATIGFSIAVVVISLSTLPLAYRSMFIQPHIALDNAMACRVFRLLRLGLITDIEGVTKPSTSDTTTLRWATAPSSKNNHDPSSDTPTPCKVELHTMGTEQMEVEKMSVV